MAQVVMSPNPKIVKKFVYGNGQTFEGGIDEALGKPVAGLQLAGLGQSKSLRGAEENVHTAPKKICLECSSVAVDGSDYCSFCKQYK